MIHRFSASLLLMLFALPQAGNAAEQDSVQRSRDFTARQEQYQATISEIQSESGPVDPRLAEPIAALSEQLIETGQYGQALELLDQQLQIKRVNEGLYSPGQIPVIEKIMTLNARLQDWSGVSVGVDHLSWLHSRNEETPAPERLAAMQRLRDWHMLLLNHDSRDREALHLLDIRDLSDRSLELARQHYGADDPALVDFLYERAQAELYIALAIALTSETGPFLITSIEGIAQTSMRPADSRYSISDIELTYGPRVSTVIDRSFRNAMGRHLSHLTAIHDYYAEQGNAEAQAMAKLHMADSVLMREQYESQPMELAGRRRGKSNIGSAARMYAEAAELMVNSGIARASVDRFFSCPALLPENRFSPEFPADSVICPADAVHDLGDVHLLVEAVPGPSRSPAVQAVANDVSTQTFAVVDFTVLANGQPGRIEIVSSAPDTTHNRVRAREVVERLQFRPALSDGSPETREHVRMRLVLPAD